MESSKRSLFCVMAKVLGFYTVFFVSFSGSWCFLIGGKGTLIRGVQAPWRGYHQTCLKDTGLNQVEVCLWGRKKLWNIEG